MLFLAFSFAVKLVDKHEVWCASKADTVDNPVAVIVLSDTINSSPAFWEQQINKKRVRQKLILTRNENPMIITMISVCSEMITYKAVKANSWLQYRFPYLNIGNRQAV